MALVGLVPAAGMATRLQPLGCSKEMLPIAGRPVIDHLLERMHAVHCDEIRVVTRRDKWDVFAHVARGGATVIEARPASLSESLTAGLAGLAGDDVVLIGFPDTIWEPRDGYREVIALLRRGYDVGLGLFCPDPDELPRYEPVIAGVDGRVERIEFHPERPSSDWTWGIAAAPADVLRGLGGREPGVLFDELALAGRVGSVRLSAAYRDIGTPEGLRRAGGALTRAVA
jgi:NDP-sugar pyrophosphorylase family protein